MNKVNILKILNVFKIFKDKEGISVFPWRPWGLLCLLIVAFSFLAFSIRKTLENNSNSPARLEEETLISQIFLKAIPSLKTRWELGDLEEHFSKGKFACPEEIVPSPHVDSQYLRCNPNYLQCYFSGKAGTDSPELAVNLAGRTYHVVPMQDFPAKISYSSARRFYTIVSRSTTEGSAIPAYGIQMNLMVKEFPQYSLGVVLEDSCHDTYLPQRMFSYGPSPSFRTRSTSEDGQGPGDWMWDNFYRDIYVDKFQVTFRDLIEWVEHSRDGDDLELPRDRDLWPRPAHGIQLDTMKKFCAFRGKQLMEAHVFDAASFYPSDWDNPWTPQIKRGPYPWTRKTVFQEKFQEKITKEFCRLIYSQQCLELVPPEYFSTQDASWVEMNQILGGHLEAFRNPLYPKENLKASSFYFPAKSAWHQLGLRSYWDGQGFKRDNINWEIHKIKNPNLDSPPSELVNPDQSYQIGFRCMKFTEGEKIDEEK